MTRKTKKQQVVYKNEGMRCDESERGGVVGVSVGRRRREMCKFKEWKVFCLT